MSTYSKLLLDPRWQRKRLDILKRDDFTCTLCTDSRTTLHVHHKAYKGNPWDIPDDQLRTLCHHCHEITHHLKNHTILAIKKQHSWNGKCWEVVAFTTTDLIFLYLFFTSDQIEIVSVFSNDKMAA